MVEMTIVTITVMIMEIKNKQTQVLEQFLCLQMLQILGLHLSSQVILFQWQCIDCNNYDDYNVSWH